MQGGNNFKFKQNDKILTKNHSSDFDMCSSPPKDQFFCVKILFFSCMRLSTDESVKKHQFWMLEKLKFLFYWFKILQPMTSQIEISTGLLLWYWFKEVQIVKKSSYIPAYTRTLVLRKELRRSRLKPNSARMASI